MTSRNSWALAAVFFCSSPALAQQALLRASPGQVEPGGTVTVTFADRTKAGTTINVEITNDSILNPQYDQVSITLDASGRGRTTWQAPTQGWSAAVFSAPGAADVSVSIEDDSVSTRLMRMLQRWFLPHEPN